MTPKMSPARIQFKPINQAILANSTHHGADGGGQVVCSSPLAGAGGRRIRQSNDGCVPIGRCLGHSCPFWSEMVCRSRPDWGPNCAHEQTRRRHIYCRERGYLTPLVGKVNPSHRARSGNLFSPHVAHVFVVSDLLLILESCL